MDLIAVEVEGPRHVFRRHTLAALESHSFTDGERPGQSMVRCRPASSEERDDPRALCICDGQRLVDLLENPDICIVARLRWQQVRIVVTTRHNEVATIYGRSARPIVAVDAGRGTGRGDAQSQRERYRHGCE
jgi:hypothetical protein